MKILKKALIVIFIIIVLPFIIALFVKNEYAVERSVTINKTQSEVFNYIKYLKNQEEFSVWAMADPDMQTMENGTDGTVGYIYGWNGNDDVGEGEMEITGIKENEKLDIDLRFKRPFESNGKAYMTTSKVGSKSTKVTWGMYGVSSYPMNFMNLFMESMVGKDLQAGLNNLKTNLEK